MMMTWHSHVFLRFECMVLRELLHDMTFFFLLILVNFHERCTGNLKYYCVWYIFTLHMKQNNKMILDNLKKSLNSFMNSYIKTLNLNLFLVNKVFCANIWSDNIYLCFFICLSIIMKVQYKRIQTTVNI